MGKITKKPQEKHKLSLVRSHSHILFLLPGKLTMMPQSTAVSEFVKKLTNPDLFGEDPS